MTKRIAVYAFSADPITFGHINLIERASGLYDELHLVIAVNPTKSALLTISEKVETVRASVSHLSNVTVQHSTGRYIVYVARELGAQVIIRGLRNAKDFEDEGTLAEENRHIAPEIETLWMPCLPHLGHVSSSVVKGHIGADPLWAKRVSELVPKPVLLLLEKKQTLQKARVHWQAYMKALGVKDVDEEVFSRIVSSYSEQHRSYHTLTHIVSMLDGFEEVRHLVANPTEVLGAIWWHDVIYDTEPKFPLIASNEERSAARAEEDCGILGVPTHIVDAIKVKILASAHSSSGEVYDIDTQVFLDLDLAVLGSKDRYVPYKVGVRFEYSWVERSLYNQKRLEILQRFLREERLYLTEHFHTTYDKQARINLANEIVELSV